MISCGTILIYIYIYVRSIKIPLYRKSQDIQEPFTVATNEQMLNTGITETINYEPNSL